MPTLQTKDATSGVEIEIDKNQIYTCVGCGLTNNASCFFSKPKDLYIHLLYHLKRHQTIPNDLFTKLEPLFE